MRRSLLLLLTLSAALFACNKTPDPQVDVISQLRTGKWKINSGTVTMHNLNWIQKDQTYWPTLRKICLRDDYIIFDSSDRGVVYSNTTRCSPADVDSIAFVWQLKNNDKNIDLFNIYKVVDSVAVTLVPIASTSPQAYKVQYDTATSYVSNIRNAKLSNVTDNSFTLEYSLIAKSYDSTGGHYSSPVLRPDTFVFHVTYSH